MKVNNINCPFDISKTGMSYYDNFLNSKDLKYMEKSKNRTGRIEYMSATDYFKECANTIFKGRVTVDILKKQRGYDKEDIDKYSDLMLHGTKFPICFLNYADSSQEGLHRMMSAGNVFGWDTKFPVLCVYVHDKDREDKIKTVREMRDFEDYMLKDICSKAEENLSNYSEPCPDNICELFKKEVEKISKENGYDVVVNTEIETIDGYKRMNCYLVKFNGLENEYQENKSDSWISNMFKDDDSENSLNFDINLDDQDFDIDLFESYNKKLKRRNTLMKFKTEGYKKSISESKRPLCEKEKFSIDVYDLDEYREVSYQVLLDIIVFGKSDDIDFEHYANKLFNKKDFANFKHEWRKKVFDTQFFNSMTEHEYELFVYKLCRDEVDKITDYLIRYSDTLISGVTSMRISYRYVDFCKSMDYFLRESSKRKEELRAANGTWDTGKKQRDKA